MKKMTGFLTVLAAAAVLTGTILSVSAEAYAIGVRENNARKGENSSDKVCAVSTAIDKDKERERGKVDKCAVSAAVDKNNKGKIDNIAFKAVSNQQNDKARIRNLGTRAARLSGKNNHNDRDRVIGRTYTKSLAIM